MLALNAPCLSVSSITVPVMVLIRVQRLQTFAFLANSFGLRLLAFLTAHPESEFLPAPLPMRATLPCWIKLTSNETVEDEQFRILPNINYMIPNSLNIMSPPFSPKFRIVAMANVLQTKGLRLTVDAQRGKPVFFCRSGIIAHIALFNGDDRFD